jgi:hypothetical protein
MKRITNTCVVAVILVITITTVSFAKVSAKLPTCAAVAKYLIDLKGWEADPKGKSCEENYIILQTNATVVRNYNQGEKTIGVIMYLGWNEGNPFSEFNEGNSPLGYAKTMNISGHKIAISYQHIDQGKGGVIYVLLNIKEVYGLNWICLRFNGLSDQEALEIAQKFSWTGIESEFK